jgi:hypothetical protein
MHKNVYGMGPHYERMAKITKRISSDEMLERIRNKEENPLNYYIDKFKKQLSTF